MSVDISALQQEIRDAADRMDFLGRTRHEVCGRDWTELDWLIDGHEVTITCPTCGRRWEHSWFYDLVPLSEKVATT